MKVMFSNKTTKLAAFLMFGLMGLLIANMAFFTHAHQLKDGTIINHAHPYNRSNDTQPYKSHHHTQNEFVFFNNIHAFVLVALSITGISIILNQIFYSVGTITACLLKQIDPFKGRSPPYYQ